MFKLRASFSLLQMTLHQLSKLLLVHKYVLISEYNKNNTLVKGFILLWKDKLNPKYLRILNNVLVFLWNDEMILKMLFAMNEETISMNEETISINEETISIDNETILFATCKKFI